MTVKIPAFFSASARTQRLAMLRVVRAAEGAPVMWAPDPDDHGFAEGTGDDAYGRGPVFGVTLGQDFAVRVVRELVTGSAPLYARIEGAGAARLQVLRDGVAARAEGHGAFLLSASSDDDTVWLRAVSGSTWAEHRDEKLGAEGSDTRRDKLQEAIDAEREDLRDLARKGLQRAAMLAKRNVLLARYRREVVDALRAEGEARAASHSTAERQRRAVEHVRRHAAERFWQHLDAHVDEYRQQLRAALEAPPETPSEDEDASTRTTFLRRQNAFDALEGLKPSAAAEPTSLDEIEESIGIVTAPPGDAGAPHRETRDEAEARRSREHEAHIAEVLRELFPWWVERRARRRLARETRESYWAERSPDAPAEAPSLALVRVHAGDERALGPELAQFTVALYELKRVPVAVHQAVIQGLHAQAMTYLVDPGLAELLPEVPLDEPASGLDDEALAQLRSLVAASVERRRHAAPEEASPEPDAPDPLTDLELVAPWFNLPREVGISRMFELLNAGFCTAGLRFCAPPAALIQRFNDDKYDPEAPRLLCAEDRVPIDSTGAGSVSQWIAQQHPTMAVLARNVPDALNLHIIGTFEEVGPAARFYFQGISLIRHAAEGAAPRRGRARVFDRGPLDWRSTLRAEGVDASTVYPNARGHIMDLFLDFEARSEGLLREVGRVTASLPGLDVGVVMGAYFDNTSWYVLGTHLAARLIAHEFGHILGANHYANTQKSGSHRNLWGHRTMMFSEMSFTAAIMRSERHPSSPARTEVGYGVDDSSGGGAPSYVTGWLLAQKRFPDEKFAPRDAHGHTDQATHDALNLVGLRDDQRHARVMRAGAIRGDWRPIRAGGGGGGGGGAR